MFSLSTASTALTTGGLLNLSATGAPATSWTGALAKFEYNNADADVDGSALKVGLLGTTALGSGTALNITTSQTGTGALALRVNDDGTYTDSTPFVVDMGGNVGIGTTAPTVKLTIVGETKSDIFSTTGSNDPALSIFYLQPNSGQTGPVVNVTDLAATGSYFKIMSTGNIGIGTTNPLEVLDVNGRLRIADSSAPGTTTNKLYSVSGNLYWNGSKITTDSSMAKVRLSGNYTNTTTTFTDVDDDSTGNSDMAFSIGANETWIININLQYTSPAAADFKSQITAPSGATCVIAFEEIEQGAQAVSAIGCNTTSGTITSTGMNDTITVHGTIVNGSTPGTVMLQFAQAVASGTSTIYAGSNLVAYRIDGADLAEVYYSDNQIIPSGSIVSLNKEKTNFVAPSQKSNDDTMLGIVSTNPGLVIGDRDTNFGIPVKIALSGRVPVKVSTINGNIQPGDPITSSDILGVGMKATKAGRIVGKALERYENSDPNAIGSILVFINLAWYDPDVYLTDTGDLSIITQGTPEQITTTNSFSLLNTGSLVDRIGAFSKLVAANIQAGLTKTQDLIVNRRAKINELEVEKLAINQTPIDQYLDERIAQQLSTVSPTPIPSTVGTVSFDPTQPTLLGELNAQEVTVSGGLSADSVTTTTIDTQNLVADSGSFELELKATDLEATAARFDVIESNLAKIDEVTALTASLADATVSGTLYVENIADLDQHITEAFTQPSLSDLFFSEKSEITQELDEINQLIASLDSTVQELSSFDKSLEELSLTEEEVVLTGSALFIEEYFRVNGTGYIAESLGIGQQLNIGNKVQLTENYLAFTADPATEDELAIFQIQPSGKGVLSIMAGLMTLDETGLVNITGNLHVAGDITTEGSLLSNLLQPVDFGNPFQVQVAGASSESGELKNSRFEIVDATGAPVATISAQGRAEFAGGIGIGSEDLSDQSASASADTVINTDKTSGKAVLPAGQSLLVIETSAITDKSLVYITPLGSTQNQVLYVASQQPDQEMLVEATEEKPEETVIIPGHFSVAVDQALDADLQFNWWIVN